MRTCNLFSLMSFLCLGLSAQAPTPQTPTLAVKWRGSFWASAVTSNQEGPNGTLFLRPVDGNQGAFTVDGLSLGADADLGKGWTLKTTVFGGRIGELINTANGQTGSLALGEAQLVWTGEKDVFRVGRMSTFLGMEFTDGTLNGCASRGLLFSYAIPFTQVGINWHHSLTPSWSTDVWVFNGEDRMADNNRAKTVGLGLNYNHGGAADKFVSLGAYRGAEQTSFGDGATPGAEGRARRRVFLNGQWVWGAFSLTWEAEHVREPFPLALLGGKPEGSEAMATWGGLGAMSRYQLAPGWALFGRAEQFKDDTGNRLMGDPAVAGLLEPDTVGKVGLDLKATTVSFGVERAWDKTFTRLEFRSDRLNRDVAGRDGEMRSANSLTWSIGSSF